MPSVLSILSVCSASASVAVASVAAAETEFHYGKAGEPPMPKGHRMHLSRQQTNVASSTVRKLRASKGPAGENPVNGSVWPAAVYWTFVDYGTPAVRYPVIIDSGSSTLTLPGKGCKGCTTAAPNIPYDPAASKTSSDTGKGLKNTYQTCVPEHPETECTIIGEFYSDNITVPVGLGPVKVSAGIVSSQTPADIYQFKFINSIMGMIPDDSGECVFQQMYEAKMIPAVWSLCISSGLNGNPSDGTMVMGGVDPKLATAAFTYVDFVPLLPFYGQLINDMKVLGSTVPHDLIFPPAVLDSGTNNVVMPESLVKGILGIMCKDTSLAYCSKIDASNPSAACFNITDAEIAQYPPVDFVLGFEGETTVTLQPQDLWLKGSPLATSSTQSCFGIGVYDEFIILGDTLMQHYYQVFDHANKRMGWAPVNKETCGKN